MCGLVIDIDQKCTKPQQIDYLNFTSALIIPSTTQCLVIAKSTEMSTRGSWGPGRWDKGGSPWRLRGKWVQEVL